MRYIDTHCHLQYPAYDAVRNALVAELGEKEIGAVLVGTDITLSRSAVALASMHVHLYATVGLHPNHTLETAFDEKEFSLLAHHPKVVAIGECGLDYFRPESVTDDVIAMQKEVFRKHIALAYETGKPLMIHARPRKGEQDAYRDVAAILTEHPGTTAIMHFFVGNRETVEQLMPLGAYVSYPSIVTYVRDYDDAIRAVPRERLLTETDSFYPAKGGDAAPRNDSTRIPEVVEALARVRGEDPETLRAQVLQNAARAFARPFLA